MSFYEISDEDVDSVVRYMKIFHPENANRQYARELLEYFKAAYHHISMTDPRALDELYKSYEASKN